MGLAKNIPKDLAELFQVMVTEFPAILRGNLVGIYVWGSLTYNAFDKTCSDVDVVAVTARDLDEREFSELDVWFKKKDENPWVKRIDMRCVIDGEFLDKTSRCCGFYHYTGKLVRHGSDGNPIIWINIAQSGVTLWGRDAKLIAPHVSGSVPQRRSHVGIELPQGRPALPIAASDLKRRLSITPTRCSLPVASFTQPIGGRWFPKMKPVGGQWARYHPYGAR